MDHNGPDALTKTTRINLLLDFYEELLTEKQRTILGFYYRDDFSLGEIASEFGISRQAVYDNIRRAQLALESYEEKLELLARHEQTTTLTEQLEACFKELELNKHQQEELALILERLRSTEIIAGLEAIKNGSI